jgi:hypothetical protein
MLNQIKAPPHSDICIFLIRLEDSGGESPTDAVETTALPKSRP